MTVPARPSEAIAGSERAGLVTRAIAGVVDLLLVLLMFILGYLLFAAADLVIAPGRFHWPEPGSATLAWIGILSMVAYLSAAWSTTGRTAGDQLMGIRVVNVLGERITVVRALARSVLSVVFPIGLLWCALDRRRRSLQDVLVGTVVMYDWQSRIPPREARTTHRPRRAVCAGISG